MQHPIERVHAVAEQAVACCDGALTALSNLDAIGARFIADLDRIVGTTEPVDAVAYLGFLCEAHPEYGPELTAILAGVHELIDVAHDAAATYSGPPALRRRAAAALVAIGARA